MVRNLFPGDGMTLHSFPVIPAYSDRPHEGPPDVPSVLKGNAAHSATARQEWTRAPCSGSLFGDIISGKFWAKIGPLP